MKNQSGKLRVWVIEAVMLLALCACGGGSGDSAPTSETPTDPTTGGTDTPTTPGTSGVFPHTANPMSVMVTEADSAIAGFDVGSSADATVQTPSGASDIAVADGVSVSFGFPGDTFLESQSLAVTSVTLAALDDTHPLPFQSVRAAFKLAPSDSSIPELRARNLVRVTFTLTQAALDALGGEPLIFSANADGTQVHLVPVVANGDGTWATLTLTTAVDHLGIFGIAALSDAQAATLAGAWPSYDDYQLEAAMAPASYHLRKSTLSSSGSVLATTARAKSARVRAADTAGDTTDWAAQMAAQLEAFYNDVVAPAMTAAQAADADIAQYRDAIQKIASWERQRQLLGEHDDRDDLVSQQMLSLARQIYEKAKQACSANHDAAAGAQLLGAARTIALLGGEAEDAVALVWGTCHGDYDVWVSWNQVNSADYAYAYDEAVHMTRHVTKRTTSTGTLHVTGSVPAISGVTAEGFLTDNLVCGDGAPFSCVTQKAVVSFNDTAATAAGGTFYGSANIDRWNLDARGHYATPHFNVSFANQYDGDVSFSVVTSPSSGTTTRYDASGNVVSTGSGFGSDTVNAATWSGGAGLGTSQRVVRRSAAVVGQYIESGATEYWATTLRFTITEVPAN